MNTHHIGVGSLLRYHLFFLYGTHAVLRIENNDPGSWHIREACKSCFSGVSGGGREDYDLAFGLIFLRRRGHQVGKNGKSHILKGDGRSMEQLQVIGLPGFFQRSDGLRIEFLIVGRRDTVF